MAFLSRAARLRSIRRAAATLSVTAISLAAMTATQAQTTTLGTRGLTSSPNPALTSNAGAKWGNYTRPEVYPNAKTLPLQFVTLSSGKKLAVFVSVPADSWGRQIPGTFPVVLTQTAYRIDLSQLMGQVVPSNTTLLIGGLDKFMVKRGYITVAFDVYGTGMSGGLTKLIGEEEQQGYAEAVAWINKQPWFNGSIGVAGTSYLGITSLLTAEQQHPSIKAVFAEVPMGDAYRGVVGTGGLLNALFLSKWLVLTQNLSVANTPAVLLHPLDAGTINAATQDHIAAIKGWYFPTIDAGLGDALGVATDDGSFWSVRSPLENANKINVPTFIIGAATDIFQRDEPLLYEQLKNRVNTKLVIVPGAHIQAVLAATGDKNNTTSYGPPGSETLLLQWFDQYVMGRETGAQSLPNVTQYVAGYGASGTERYATATDWPNPQMTAQRMYLHGNGSLTAAAPASGEPGHVMSAEPAAPTVTKGTNASGAMANASVNITDGSDCSVSDLQWTLGLAATLYAKPCFSDDAKVEAAQGAVIYETPVLSSDLYLNGPMQADIWMSATNAQAAVSVRVDDVNPATGAVTPLSNGLMSADFRAVDASRSRYVNGVMIQPWHPFTAASRQAVVPGQPMLVPVEIFPTAALVHAGHKLRVAISPSNQAQGLFPTDKQAQAAGNVSTILNDAAHPSSIVLPVVPSSALN